jgi:hypothetical protein
LETRFLHALGVVNRMNPITLKTVLHDSAKLFAFNSLICSAKLDTLLPSLMCQEKQAVANQNEAQPTGDLKPVEQVSVGNEQEDGVHESAQQLPTEAAKAQENFEQVTCDLLGTFCT